MELYYKYVAKIMAIAAIILRLSTMFLVCGTKKLYQHHIKIGLCNHKYGFIYNFLKQGRIICLLSCSLLHNNWGLSKIIVLYDFTTYLFNKMNLFFKSLNLFEPSLQFELFTALDRKGKKLVVKMKFWKEFQVITFFFLYIF